MSKGLAVETLNYKDQDGKEQKLSLRLNFRQKASLLKEHNVNTNLVEQYCFGGTVLDPLNLSIVFMALINGGFNKKEYELEEVQDLMDVIVGDIGMAKFWEHVSAGILFSSYSKEEVEKARKRYNKQLDEAQKILDESDDEETEKK